MNAYNGDQESWRGGQAALPTLGARVSCPGVRSLQMKDALGFREDPFIFLKAIFNQIIQGFKSPNGTFPRVRVERTLSFPYEDLWMPSTHCGSLRMESSQRSYNFAFLNALLALGE